LKKLSLPRLALPAPPSHCQLLGSHVVQPVGCKNLFILRFGQCNPRAHHHVYKNTLLGFGWKSQSQMCKVSAAPLIPLHIHEGKIRESHFYSLTNGDSYLHSKTSMTRRCVGDSQYLQGKVRKPLRDSFLAEEQKEHPTKSHHEAKPSALNAQRLRRDQSKAFLSWGSSEVQSSRTRLQQWDGGGAHQGCLEMPTAQHVAESSAVYCLSDPTREGAPVLTEMDLPKLAFSY